MRQVDRSAMDITRYREYPRDGGGTEGERNEELNSDAVEDPLTFGCPRAPG
jgi:hypothetical protein